MFLANFCSTLKQGNTSNLNYYDFSVTISHLFCYHTVTYRRIGARTIESVSVRLVDDLRERTFVHKGG